MAPPVCLFCDHALSCMLSLCAPSHQKDWHFFTLVFFLAVDLFKDDCCRLILVFFFLVFTPVHTQQEYPHRFFFTSHDTIYYLR